MTQKNDETIPAEHEPLQIGQRIHCILYGGKNGVIYAITGQQAPLSTRTVMNGVGTAGGRAHFDIVWDNGGRSPSIPEALARRSVQWRLLPGVADSDEIARMLEHHAQTAAKAKAEEERAAVKFAEGKARLIKDYPYLTPVTAGTYAGAKFCAANLRIELKRAFPGVKFSVTSSDTLSVKWVDGPTNAEVDKFARKYKSGRFNGMEDIYEYDNTPWGAAFGSTEYTSVKRSYSPEMLERMADYLYMAFPENMKDVPRCAGTDMLCGRERIPGMDIYLGEAMRALANAWDCIKGDFVPLEEVSVHNRWVVDFAVGARARAAGHDPEAVQGEASCPSM